MTNKSCSKIAVLAIIVGSILLFSMIPIRKKQQVFYTEEEFDFYKIHGMMMAPVDSAILFPTAKNCNGCHGFDPQMNGMVDSYGNDVNVHDDWRTSMMANSAKDPFWRAKVSHEILVNPDHSLDLQTKCTSCHAPQGHFTAILRGAEHYTIGEMLADTTAMDGVSCGACHMKSEVDLEQLFSGAANYDTSRVIYGPYVNPFAPPMNDFVGFQPLYSEHINNSGICASCHTLLTNSVNLDGTPMGDKFVEQATYHEWINSAYDDEGSTPTTCQGCHMPRLEDNIVISANYIFLQPRSPYGLHDLVGANTTMLQLMKENKDALNIDAADEHFDETIAKTLQMLQVNTLAADLELVDQDTDTAYFDFKITNKAGHKFPSGYPSRRAYVEFVVTNEIGDTLFQSGVMQSDYEVQGQTAATEPHFDVINSEDQVQIYELVLGDVNGDFTTVLERADQALKDNRLPPLGFSTTHPAYDTTRIYGAALTDSDFNYENGTEGSGADIIHYHFPINEYVGMIHVSAKVFYQALPPKWLNPMLAESTPEIDTFRTMYENADLSPVLITSTFMDSIFVQGLSSEEIVEASWLKIYPNPTTDGWINISKPSAVEIKAIKIYDSVGRLIQEENQNFTTIQLPDHANLYIVDILTDKGRVVRKILR
ncbi:MAG: T9SS type A sorting domain-containing protein [Bacteroidota bacterium]